MSLQGSHVEVKQLTMDAEHYLCVTIQTYAPWAKRYISFTDYDMQILDVRHFINFGFTLIPMSIRSRAL